MEEIFDDLFTFYDRLVVQVNTDGDMVINGESGNVRLVRDTLKKHEYLRIHLILEPKITASQLFVIIDSISPEIKRLDISDSLSYPFFAKVWSHKAMHRLDTLLEVNHGRLPKDYEDYDREVFLVKIRNHDDVILNEINVSWLEEFEEIAFMLRDHVSDKLMYLVAVNPTLEMYIIRPYLKALRLNPESGFYICSIGLLLFPDSLLEGRNLPN